MNSAKVGELKAEQIADAILGASILGTATRIALRRAPLTAMDYEQDLGGLNRVALVAIIAEALSKSNSTDVLETTTAPAEGEGGSVC